MAPDPEPNDLALTLGGKRPMVQSDTRRPDPADAFEVERRVSRVVDEKLVVPVGKPLDLFREIAIVSPESSRGPVSHQEGSTVGAAARIEIVEPFLDQPVELSCRLVSCDLTIPLSSVELGKPSAEGGHVRRRESLDGCLDFFDSAHERKSTDRDIRSQSPIFGRFSGDDT